MICGNNKLLVLVRQAFLVARAIQSLAIYSAQSRKLNLLKHHWKCFTYITTTRSSNLISNVQYQYSSTVVPPFYIPLF